MTTGGEGTWAQLRYTGANLNIKLLRKKHTILYVHSVDLLIWSLTQLDFIFYDFSVIYYDFFQNCFRG